jgi:hypothetical protein
MISRKKEREIRFIEVAFYGSDGVLPPILDKQVGLASHRFDASGLPGIGFEFFAQVGNGKIHRTVRSVVVDASKFHR